MSTPNPDKPVRLVRVYLRQAVNVQNDQGSMIACPSLSAPEKSQHIELYLRQRIIRVWPARRPSARVATVPLENVAAWEVADDVENVSETDESAPRAAPSVA